MTLGIIIFCSMVNPSCTLVQKTFLSKEECILEITSVRDTWESDTIRFAKGTCEVQGTDV